MNRSKHTRRGRRWKHLRARALRNEVRAIIARHRANREHFLELDRVFDEVERHVPSALAISMPPRHMMSAILMLTLGVGRQ